MTGAELSPEAVKHLGQLLQHRDDLERIKVEVHPARCDLCHEIAVWSAEIEDSKRVEGAVS